MSARSPDEVDAHVARRIAARRSIVGMSSASLGVLRAILETARANPSTDQGEG